VDAVASVVLKTCDGSAAKTVLVIKQVVRRVLVGYTIVAAEELSDLRTGGYVCKRLRDALAILKQCRTDVERLEYSVVLAAIAPLLSDNMIKAVHKCLLVKRNTLKAAAIRRQAINEAALVQTKR
jgi:hypothetical protein